MRPHGTLYRTHYIAQVLLPGAPITSADDWAEQFSALPPDWSIINPGETFSFSISLPFRE